MVSMPTRNQKKKRQQKMEIVMFKGNIKSGFAKEEGMEDGYYFALSELKNSMDCNTTPGCKEIKPQSWQHEAIQETSVNEREK